MSPQPAGNRCIMTAPIAGYPDQSPIVVPTLEVINDNQTMIGSRRYSAARLDKSTATLTWGAGSTPTNCIAPAL
jgi:hypothetical protein